MFALPTIPTHGLLSAFSSLERTQGKWGIAHTCRSSSLSEPGSLPSPGPGRGHPPPAAAPQLLLAVGFLRFLPTPFALSQPHQSNVLGLERRERQKETPSAGEADLEGCALARLNSADMRCPRESSKVSYHIGDRPATRFGLQPWLMRPSPKPSLLQGSLWCRPQRHASWLLSASWAFKT